MRCYRDGGNYLVDAPDFHVFRSEGLHQLVCVDRADAVDRMRQGVEPCRDPQCEWCRDTRGAKLRVVQ